MLSLIDKTLTMPLFARLLLFLNIGALAFAFTMQFGFGVEPCILCLWQRVPYGLAAFLSLLALTWKPYHRQTTFLLALCVIAYLAGMGLAIFHTGVELHWWTGTAGCAVQPLNGTSPEELRQSLLQRVTPRCDQISWTLFGFSMTNYNIAMSLALAFLTAVATVKSLKK